MREKQSDERLPAATFNRNVFEQASLHVCHQRAGVSWCWFFSRWFGKSVQMLDSATTESVSTHFCPLNGERQDMPSRHHTWNDFGRPP